MRVVEIFSLLLVLSMLPNLALSFEPGKGFEAHELKKVRAVSTAILVSHGQEKKKVNKESRAIKNDIKEIKRLLGELLSVDESLKSKDGKKDRNKKNAVSNFNSLKSRVEISKNRFDDQRPRFYELWKDDNSRATRLSDMLLEITLELEAIEKLEKGSNEYKKRLSKLKSR